MVAVNLNCQNAAGITAFPFTEAFDHHFQVAGFVVSVERVIFQSDPTVCNTDIQLGSELHRLSLHSSDDWVDKRLTDADNAIRNTVCTIVIHVLLLLVDVVERMQALCLPAGQDSSKISIAPRSRFR